MNRHTWLARAVLSAGCVAVTIGKASAAEEPKVAKEVPNVQVLVGDVTDNRTTGSFFAKCEVELKVMGDAVGDTFGIRAIRVLTAVDDTGRQLKPEQEQGPLFFSKNTERNNLLKEKVGLKNPARSAKAIQLLQGELELFHPTAENGGMVIVNGFMEKPGEPLGAPALKTQNVKVMYVTKEILDAKKRELQDKAKAKAESELQQAGQEFGDAFTKLLGGMFSGMVKEGSSLNFLADDPDKRLVELEFLDAAGKPLKGNGRTSMGELRSYSFEKLPPADTQLVIYVATPDSVTVVPFTLKDIPLP